MAKKKDTQAQEEAEILFPDADIVIGGETITVREFGFIEAMKVEPIAWPIIEALADIGTDWESVDFRQVMMVFADNAEAFVQLIAASTGKSPEWVAELNDRDGNAIANTFWRVNQGFFVRRLLVLLAPKLKARMAKTQQAASDGEPSSND
jgi:hypothetical protein